MNTTIESSEKLGMFEIRKILAESGKFKVNDMMSYLKSRYEGRYDSKDARKWAKELIVESK